MADYFQEIKKLQDKRRLLLTEAEFHKRKGEKSEHIIKLYKDAAELTRQIAEMSDGTERDHQMELCDAYLEEASTMESAMRQAQTEAQEQMDREQKRIAEEQRHLEEQRRFEEEKRLTEERRLAEERLQRQQRDAFVSWNVTNEEVILPKKSSEEEYFVKYDLPTLDDISGMQNIKESLLRTVIQLEYRKTQESLNMDTVRAVLLYGLPGCGKTYIAEGFAGEMKEKFGYPCISVGAKDILSQKPGEPQRKIHEIFQLAMQSAPCTILFDELDGLCVDRNLVDIPNWVKSVTTAFLTEYDLIRKSEKPIILVATTNYPEQLDAAMLSRMEVFKVGLPDLEAREQLFQRALSKIHAKIDLSAYEMALRTEDVDCRDINRIIDNCKTFLFQRLKERYESDEQAILALEKGLVELDEELFSCALKQTNILSKKEQLQRVEAWEKRMGICEKEEVKKQKVMPRWERRGSELVATGLELLYAQEHSGYLPDGKVNPFNPTPKKDVEIIYYYAGACFFKNTETAKETRKRYAEILLSDTTEQQVKCRERYKEIQHPSDGEYRCSFVGFANKDFLHSYDDFNTNLQGKAVRGFAGTCGIIASANMVNQQCGTRIDEAEAVYEFIEKKLCSTGSPYAGDNGGTNTNQRRNYLAGKGCMLEYIILDEDMKYASLSDEEELDLDNLYRHYCLGESIMLAIDAYDMQPFRRFTKLEKFRKAARLTTCNHAVTVGGFVVDEDGLVRGVWINDTGGFPSFTANRKNYRSNRYYIPKEIFEAMRNTTSCFTVEFVKKDRG